MSEAKAALDVEDRVELVGTVLQEWGLEFSELYALQNACAIFDAIGAVEEEVPKQVEKCAQWVYRAFCHGWWRPDAPKPADPDRCYFCTNFENNRCYIFGSAVTPDTSCGMFKSRVVE